MKGQPLVHEDPRICCKSLADENRWLSKLICKISGTSSIMITICMYQTKECINLTIFSKIFLVMNLRYQYNNPLLQNCEVMFWCIVSNAATLIL